MEFQLDLSQVDVDENTILEYQLPDGVTFNEAMSGELVGNVTGSYTLTTDGKIQIKLSREALSSHAGGKLSGGVSFKATVSNYPDSGEIVFPGCNTNIHIKRDMSVQKSNGQKNEDGTWHYKIDVTTNSGTPDKVTIEDIATLNDSKAALNYKNIVIKDKDGNQIRTADRFPISLDQLGAGGKYTIEYDVAVTDYGVNADGIRINNTVTATTGTGENEIRKTSTVTTNVADAKLQKWGWYDKANGEILWTVTVNNPGKEDLSKNGVLKDVLAEKNVGEYKEGSLQVTDASGAKITNGTVKKTAHGFDYQFPEGATSERYTLTYRTTVKKGTEGTIKNTVSFDEVSKDGSIETGKLADWGVHKDHNQLEKTDDEKISKMQWNVSLTLSEKESTNKIEYTDKIIDPVDSTGKSYSNAHYTTVGELEQEIRESFGFTSDNVWVQPGKSDDYIVNIQYFSDEELQNPVSDTSAKVKSFKVTVERKDGQVIEGTNMSFRYYTFVDTSQLKDLDQWKITNKGFFHNQETSSDYTNKTTSPTSDTAFVKERVQVWDWDSGNASKANDGEINLKDIKEDVLYYRIALKATDTQFPAVITDTLGKGMKIKTDANGNPELKIAFYDPTTGGYSTYGNPEQYVTCEKVSADENEKWKFTIANYKANGTVSHDGIEILYKVDITDHGVWKNATTEETQEQNETKYTHVFTNRAEWNDQVQKSDTRVYQIVKDFTKDGSCATTGSDAYMPKYSVVINANGKDLNANGDTIELKDTLNVWSGEAAYSYLDLNDVKLYYYDRVTGQKGEEIDASRYTVKYNQATHEITAIVPDQLPCVLEYSYKLDSNFQSSIILNNSVSFNGDVIATKQMKLMESQGYVRAEKFQVQKIDSEQNSKVLSGAQFQLYYYDATQKKFVQIKDGAGNASGTYTTDSDGRLNLTKALFPDSGNRTDLLLMLVETKAPAGYKLNSEPSYFVLENNKNVNDIYYNVLDYSYRSGDWILSSLEQSFSKIEQSAITAFSKYGGDLYVENTSDQIMVKKVWTDSDGKELTNPPDNITFELNKEITDETTLVLKTSNNQEKTFTVKKGTGATLTFCTSPWSNPTISATLNGKSIEYAEKEIDPGNNQAKYKQYTITLPKLTASKYTLNVTANAWGLPNSMDDYTLDYTAPSGVTTDSEEITLNAKNNWTYTATAEEGTKYTVTEVKVNGKPVEESNYTVSYYNNDGIDHGEIVITNKQKEKTYELPSTGGIGTTRYLAGGAALMCLAALLYGYWLSKKRKKGAE